MINKEIMEEDEVAGVMWFAGRSMNGDEGQELGERWERSGENECILLNKETKGHFRKI